MAGKPIRKYKDSHIAKVLAQLRAREGWTLADVHKRTGVSISGLSKIENGLVAPTYDVMARLADGLGLDFVELLGERPPSIAPGMRAVTRAGQGRPYETPVGQYLAIGAELASKTMQPMIVTINPKKRSSAFRSSHSGEEFLFVIEGRVEFFLEPYEPLQLDAGDSVYYHGSSKHGFVAMDDKPARILCVCLMGHGDLEDHQPLS